MPPNDLHTVITGFYGKNATLSCYNDSDDDDDDEDSRTVGNVISICGFFLFSSFFFSLELHLLKSDRESGLKRRQFGYGFVRDPPGPGGIVSRTSPKLIADRPERCVEFTIRGRGALETDWFSCERSPRSRRIRKTIGQFVRVIFLAGVRIMEIIRIKGGNAYIPPVVISV